MWKGGPPRAAGCCAQPLRPKPRVVLEPVSACDDDCAICLEPLCGTRFGGAGRLRCLRGPREPFFCPRGDT